MANIGSRTGGDGLTCVYSLMETRLTFLGPSCAFLLAFLWSSFICLVRGDDVGHNTLGFPTERRTPPGHPPSQTDSPARQHQRVVRGDDVASATILWDSSHRDRGHPRHQPRQHHAASRLSLLRIFPPSYSSFPGHPVLRLWRDWVGDLDHRSIFSIAGIVS